jgi:DNA-binding beta-propeller fold protein YncE
MIMRIRFLRSVASLALVTLAGSVACSNGEVDQAADRPAEEVAAEATASWDVQQGTDDRVAVVTGFSGPEAVRYDPDQDVYFVANFNGDGGDRDGNGFVSRVSAEGVIESLEFMTGTEEAPFHAGRGMNITGDTLWVADVDGVHGFNRNTGAHLAFIDFTAHEPGFLNDIAVGPDGALYVTDTGSSVVYRAVGPDVVVAATIPEEGRPNGIAWDPGSGRFLTVAWGGGLTLFAFDPASGAVEPWSESTGGFYDGVELVGDRVVMASQADTSLHVVEGGTSRAYVRVEGRPADIGLDVNRMRVAVPYIALDQVDIWQLPRS